METAGGVSLKAAENLVIPPSSCELFGSERDDLPAKLFYSCFYSLNFMLLYSANFVVLSIKNKFKTNNFINPKLFGSLNSNSNLRD